MKHQFFANVSVICPQSTSLLKRRQLLFVILPWVGLIICLGYIFLGFELVSPAKAGSPSLNVPELDLAISDNPDPVKLGQMLTYTITATNVGTAPATNVIVSSSLDSQVTFVSANGGGTHSSSTVTWPVVDTLAPNASVSYTVTVQVISKPDKLLALTAKVNSDEGALDCEAETTLVIAPELVLRKADDPDPARPGQLLTYTIVVTNIGNAEATNVIITDDLSSEVSFVAASHGGSHDGQPTNGVVTWPAVPTLVPWGVLTRTVSVTVRNDLACDGTTFPNTAKATAAEGVMATDTITTTVGSGTITVLACEDKNADGVCGPDEMPLPAGVQACLVPEGGTQTCKPTVAPVSPSLRRTATFTVGTGIFTASLQFTGNSQGYYPTLPPQRIELPICEDREVTLPAVNPIHPKGVAVHEGLNKVYVAFQGPKIKVKPGDDNDINNYDWPYPFVAVIDGSVDQVLRTIPGGVNSVGKQPWGVGVSGNNVYVGAGDGKITIINAATDSVVTNVSPNRPSGPLAKFTSPAVNPENDWVYFPDREGYLVALNDQSIVRDHKIVKDDPTPGKDFIIVPFEVGVTDDGAEGHSFVTLREAIKFPSTRIPFKFAGVKSNPFTLSYYDILKSDGNTTGSPHALGLWPDTTTGKSRLFITYSDKDPRVEPPDYFPNPNRLLVYEFPTNNPQNVTRVGEMNLDHDFAEVGLVYDKTNKKMLGTYAGFAYDLGHGRSDVQACNSTQRGGTYWLDSEGNPLPGFKPTRVVGNLPITSVAGGIDWRNPFELAINSQTKKVYVTDRCWNIFNPGADKTGGAVLVYDPNGNTGDGGGQNPSLNQAIYLPSIIKE